MKNVARLGETFVWSAQMFLERQNAESFQIRRRIEERAIPRCEIEIRRLRLTAAGDQKYARIALAKSLGLDGLLNFNVGVKTQDEKWKLTGWIHNALDKRYFTNRQGNLLSGGLIGGTVGDPIMGGVALAVTF